MAQRSRAVATTPTGSGGSKPGPRTANARYLPLRDAAELISMTPGALRKLCERNTRTANDGATQAAFDGLLARKVGGRWRVALSELWTSGPVVGFARQDPDRHGLKEAS